MKKIMIIGCGGVGKSTLARKLKDLLNLPVYHLDQLYWKAGWQESDSTDWKVSQLKLCQQDEWIIDGNYGSSIDIRMAAADTIIFLDYPRWRSLYGIIKRRIQYQGRTRPDMTEGCEERLDPVFLKWIWNYHRDSRPVLLEKIAAIPSEKTLIQLTNHKEVYQYLQDLKLSVLDQFKQTT